MTYGNVVFSFNLNADILVEVTEDLEQGQPVSDIAELECIDLAIDDNGNTFLATDNGREFICWVDNPTFQLLQQIARDKYGYNG